MLVHRTVLGDKLEMTSAVGSPGRTQNEQNESAPPLKADIERTCRIGRLVPKPELGCSTSVRNTPWCNQVRLDGWPHMSL